VKRILAIVAVILPIWLAAARPANAQVRIMPLGDSITGSPGCWRALLWNDLQGDGFTAIDFVGTLPLQGCGVAYDGDTVGSFTQSHSSTAAAITYQYTLNAGQTLSPGTGWLFAAQSGGSGTAHPTSGDTCTLVYTAAGVSHTLTGHF